MTKRKAISKKLRFEVFKRDRFTCQYCGKGAPDVVLHVDHINPVARGGDADILNLITSCQDCNLGKGARELSDATELARQRKQLEELSERREQLEAMLAWRDGLRSIDEEALEAVCEAWNDQVSPMGLTEVGRKAVSDLIKKFGVQIVLQAIDKAVDQYVQRDFDGNIREHSVNRAFEKLGGIAYFMANPDQKEKQQLAYIRGILRNRCGYVNDRLFFTISKKAVALGYTEQSLKDLALSCTSWTQFKNAVEDAINGEDELVED